MDSAVTAAQQPGTPTTRMPASMAARISSLPGSEMQGVPASVMTAMLLPCRSCSMNHFALPYSLNLWLAESWLPRMPSLLSSTTLRRVSSAAMMSAVSKI